MMPHHIRSFDEWPLSIGEHGGVLFRSPRAGLGVLAGEVAIECLFAGGLEIPESDGGQHMVEARQAGAAELEGHVGQGSAADIIERAPRRAYVAGGPIFGQSVIDMAI